MYKVKFGVFRLYLLQIGALPNYSLAIIHANLKSILQPLALRLWFGWVSYPFPLVLHLY